MGSPKDQGKADKKASKAKLKAGKKAAKAASEMSPSTGAADPGSSPAERSAGAAEEQVRLQRFRVLFAMLMFLVAVVTLLWTVKPWKYLGGSASPAPVPAGAETRPE